MIDSLESAQIAINVTLDYARAPNQRYLVRAQKVAIGSISNVVEICRWHAIVLRRFLKALLLEDEPDQPVFEVRELKF